MSIKAIIELEETQLIWTQTTKCRTKLINGSDETLLEINPANIMAAAAIIVKNIKTGEETSYSFTLEADSFSQTVSLEPGGKLENEFELSELFQFSSCGIFDLRACFEWKDGRLESEPVRLEILSANPQTLHTVIPKSGEIGEVYCVWLNKDKEDVSYYLSLINTHQDAGFVWSKPLKNISAEETPVLSAPTNTIPMRQYIAAVSGHKLHILKLIDGQMQSEAFELDAEDYVIVPPVLEDGYIQGVKKNTEILFFLNTDKAWQMRVAILGKTPLLNEEIRKLGGEFPQWFQTVSRENGERFTFILLPQVSKEGNPYIKLAVSLWGAGIIPAKPVFLNNWQGKLLAADVLHLSDGRIIGVLLTKQTGEKNEYQLQKWQLDENDQLTLSEIPPLKWDEKWKIEHSILRLNGQGEPFLLLKDETENNCYWIDGRGEITFLEELSPQLSLPADIIFIDQLYPVILYTDKTCGLKLHYLGLKRVSSPNAKVL